jgi:hypothetical protein
MIRYRKTIETDRPRIAADIAADPDHAGKSTVEFWLPQNRAECFTLEDGDGPVFSIRAESVLRLHVQFPPKSKMRIARALLEFLPKIEHDAKSKGFVQVIWESTSTPLISFVKRFGYRSSQNEIVKDVKYEEPACLLPTDK